MSIESFSFAAIFQKKTKKPPQTTIACHQHFKEKILGIFTKSSRKAKTHHGLVKEMSRDFCNPCPLAFEHRMDKEVFELGSTNWAASLSHSLGVYLVEPIFCAHIAQNSVVARQDGVVAKLEAVDAKRWVRDGALHPCERHSSAWI
jgi:hypothetical protein